MTTQILLEIYQTGMNWGENQLPVLNRDYVIATSQNWETQDFVFSGVEGSEDWYTWLAQLSS